MQHSLPRAGRCCLRNSVLGGGARHCKDVPATSQRPMYDFIEQPERHLWWCAFFMCPVAWGVCLRCWGSTTPTCSSCYCTARYLACFAEGGCCAGPQRRCTKEDRVALAGSCSVPCFMGWPSFMVDHTAIRNRMVQVRTHREHTAGLAVVFSVQIRRNPLPVPVGHVLVHDVR